MPRSGYKADPQGKDELWDVTSKMEMPGMPMAMPAQTRRVCVEKGNDAANAFRRNDGCTVVDTKRVGNKFTYRMECKKGKDDYVATGESTSGASGLPGDDADGRQDGGSVDGDVDGVFRDARRQLHVDRADRTLKACGGAVGTPCCTASSPRRTIRGRLGP